MMVIPLRLRWGEYVYRRICPKSRRMWAEAIQRSCGRSPAQGHGHTEAGGFRSRTQ